MQERRSYSYTRAGNFMSMRWRNGFELRHEQAWFRAA